MRHTDTTSEPTASQSSDVVIVGAGMSGLVAARKLQQAQVDVVVLEARDRVGGRLLSRRLANGGSVDLGATWFWANEPRIQALIAELEVPVHEQYLQGDALYHDANGTQRIDGNPVDAVSGRFVDGAQSLASALAAQLTPNTIALNAAVTGIAAKDDCLLVTTSAGDWSAGHVVLALPPALAAHAIDFQPPLPAQVQQLATQTPVWMGAIAKFVIVFDQPFWRDRGLAGSAMSQVGPLREIHDMCGPDGTPAALFGFAPLQAGQPTPSVDDVCAQLRALFGTDMPAPVDIIVADWRAEPHTSPPNVETHTNYSTYGHPTFTEPTSNGRLHWASTETSAHAPGHIEGAIVGGERAAAAIIHAHR